MIRIFIFSLLILAIFSADQHNGTQSYFLSAHGLGKTPEVDNALSKISGQVKVTRTLYNQSSWNYAIQNVTIGFVYNDGKQNTTIPKADLVMVTGGSIQFTYKFNYTKSFNGKVSTAGYIYGSVLSDPITYYKEFTFCGGFLCWRLPPSKGFDPVNITKNAMKIKRMEPYTADDATVIQSMLEKITDKIDPSNIKTQILTSFNQLFPLALNDSLNHQIFGQKVNYTFNSQSHGPISMNIVHQLQTMGISPDDGYKVIYKTAIQDHPNINCTKWVPQSSFSFQTYGGTQNFHAMCLYQEVLNYLLANNWLDTKIDYKWQVNQFQFYAGDLFDMVSSLSSAFSPRAIIEGTCSANKGTFNLKYDRNFGNNYLLVQGSYNCVIRGTNKQGSQEDILKFTPRVLIDIKLSLNTNSLSFTTASVDFQTINFESVGSYFVVNKALFQYKAEKVFKKMIGTPVFGNGYPTVARDMPRVEVRDEYIVFYDSSHFGKGEIM